MQKQYCIRCGKPADKPNKDCMAHGYATYNKESLELIRRKARENGVVV